MLANQVITVEVVGTCVTIMGHVCGKEITFLGGSCPASVEPGQKVDSLSFSPGDNGDVVAIKVRRDWYEGKCRMGEDHHYLLSITQKNGSPWVELDKPFVPKPDRLCQIVPDYGLSVCIGGEFFMSPILFYQHRSEGERAEQLSRYRLVSIPDANLLCRYIAGQATAEEVMAAATERVVQIVEVPALSAKIVELQVENSQLESKISRLNQDFDISQRDVSERELKDLRKINALKWKLEGVIGESLQIINGTMNSSEGLGWWNTNGTKLRALKRFFDKVRLEMQKPV